MKMSRAQLKAIVKECLVEILNEGLGNSLSTQNNSNSIYRQTMADSQTKAKSIIPERRIKTNVQQEKIVALASGGNPILESILADTARTTYQEQVEADRIGTTQKTGIERIVDESTPEQLFGAEAANNWMSILDRVSKVGV